MAQAKLIGMTIGLTLLIWVSADQLLKETDELLVNIRPVPAGSPDMSVVLARTPLQPFRVRVSGPRKIVAKSVASGPIAVDLPIAERSTGRHELKLEAELRRLPRQFAGLSIEEVLPPTLEVIVDHDVTVSMPVRVDPGTTGFAAKPTIDPANVQVTMSQIALEGLPPEIPGISPERRFVTLRAERHLDGVPEGEPFSRNAALETNVAGIKVKELNPREVRLDAKLLERRKSAVVQAVPIRFQASQAIFNRYVIDRRDNLTVPTQAITVRGPAEVVDQIVAGQTRLVAVIQVSTQDAEDAGTFRHVIPAVLLPEGVELAEEPASVEFRLLPRDAPNPG